MFGIVAWVSGNTGANVCSFVLLLSQTDVRIKAEINRARKQPEDILWFI
jgi:hypothetical protein